MFYSSKYMGFDALIDNAGLDVEWFKEYVSKEDRVPNLQDHLENLVSVLDDLINNGDVDKEVLKTYLKQNGFEVR